MEEVVKDGVKMLQVSWEVDENHSLKVELWVEDLGC